MPANYVKVKAKPGRVARTSARGDFIPEDRFVSVHKTPYITRLIEHHEDLELFEEPKADAKVDEASSKKKESK